MKTKSKFYCSHCQKKFEAKKIKQESFHPIYGACWKYIAACPVCKEKCDEFKVKVAVKSSPESGCCMENSGSRKPAGCNGCNC